MPWTRSWRGVGCFFAAVCGMGGPAQEGSGAGPRVTPFLRRECLAPDVAIKAHTGADRYFRRNFSLFLTEYAMRHVAIAFIDPNIILPVFLSRLTDSPLLIGLNSSLPFTMWLFPQLFAARYLSGKTHRKQYILILMLANRPVCFVLALALLLGSVRYPPLMLALVTLGSSVLWATQGLSSVAWLISSSG